MKLEDGRLSFGCPSTYPGRAFAGARFVDEDNQPAFSLFFLGQVRRFRARTAFASRSIARFQPFLRAETQRSLDAPDLCLAKAHAGKSVDENADALECPKPAAKAVFGRPLQDSGAACASCMPESRAGRPGTATARSAPMQPSSSSAFQVYTVYHATLMSPSINTQNETCKLEKMSCV